MIITYERNAPNKEVKRDYFHAYRWYNFKDSLILDQLWDVIVKSDENFDSLCVSVKESYKNKTVKSKAQIHQTAHTLEVLTKGVFLKIIVYKNEQYRTLASSKL